MYKTRFRKPGEGGEMYDGFMYAVEDSVPLPTGGEQTILKGYAKDAAALESFLAQHQDTSHTKFFQSKPLVGRVQIHQAAEQLLSTDEEDVRHSVQRIDALERLFQGILTPRVQAGAFPHAIHVTFEEYMSMHAEYKAAASEGMQAKSSFQPLSSYHHKIVQEKRTIRPILANEVGVWTDRDGVGHTILLKDQGPGDIGETCHQVPDTVTHEPEHPAQPAVPEPRRAPHVEGTKPAMSSRILRVVED